MLAQITLGIMICDKGDQLSNSRVKGSPISPTKKQNTSGLSTSKTPTSSNYKPNWTRFGHRYTKSSGISIF